MKRWRENSNGARNGLTQAGGEYIFVYGTLRPNASGDSSTGKMQRLLEKNAVHVGRGSVRGKLYQIDWYPALRESRGTDDRVVGDVFKLSRAVATMAALDKYEDASTEKSATAEYIRQRRLVSLQDGTRIRAWTYVYNRPVRNKPRIESGDFLRRERAR